MYKFINFLKSSFSSIKIKNSAFTLIEILIVVAVIGTLSTIVAVNATASNAKVRDAKRLSDLNTLNKALELYFDANGHYPDVSVAFSGGTNVCYPYNDVRGNTRWCFFVTEIAPYLASIPQDPLGTNNSYGYYYTSNYADNANTYGLMIRLESPSNYHLAINDGGSTNNTTDGRYYELGQRPQYCKNKYLNQPQSLWWGYNNTICGGGN